MIEPLPERQDPASREPVLRVRDLHVAFSTRTSQRSVVIDVSFNLFRGQTLAFVGESGCGKTVTALSLLSLLEPPGQVVSGSIQYGEHELVGASNHLLCRLRGNRLAMVFQEPMAALNPVMRVGDQVAEPLLVHRAVSADEARHRAIRLLGEVGIGSPEQYFNAYPHELSGGMRQRVMIAMALACEPEVIIADEPTTALDVTIQWQILALLRKLQRERDAAMLFITHDLILVEAIADEVAVMYAGRIVEQGPVDRLVASPRHPYTRALWRANPALHDSGRLHAIDGTVPDPDALPPGCAFHDRCDRPQERCWGQVPVLEEGVACFFPHDQALRAGE